MDQNNNFQQTQNPVQIPSAPAPAAQPQQVPTVQAPVYAAPVVQTPVYGNQQPVQTPAYSAQQPVQTPTYGAQQPVQAPAAPVYAAPAVQTPTYIRPATETIYAKNVNGQTIYVDSQGNQVNPIFVDANGNPIPQPAPLTPEQQYKRIRSQVRTDMGRHGGVLLLGQLVTGAVQIIGMIILVASLLVTLGIDNSAEIMGMTQTDMFQNSFGMMLVLAIASLLGNTLIYIPFAKKRGIRPFARHPEGMNPSAKWFFGALLAGLGLNYLWGYIFLGLSTLFPKLSSSSFPIDPDTFDIKTLVVYSVMVCLIAPVTEEFIFRGVLLGSLRRYGDRLAIITTALFFGLMHGNLAQTPMAFLLGLVLGYVAVKTGSIWYPILIHFINNTYSTILTILQMKLPQYESLFNYIDLGIGSLFIIGMVIVLIVNRKKIGFPKDSEEVRAGPIRHRYGLFFSAFWNIFFIALMLLTIVLTIFMSDMTSGIMSEMDPGFFSRLIGII